MSDEDADDYDPKTAAVGSFAGHASSEPLAPMKERIAKAQEQARVGREERGLPVADDGPFSDDAMKARKKRRKR